jgi:hypothetical protein
VTPGVPGTPPVKFPVASTVTVRAGGRTGTVATVEAVTWSERDRRHYYYLISAGAKLSRGYTDDELVAGVAP